MGNWNGRKQKYEEEWLLNFSVLGSYTAQDYFQFILCSPQNGKFGWWIIIIHFFFLSWLDWKLSYNVMSHSSSLWILMSPFKFQGKILDFCYSSIIGKKKSWAPRGTMTRPQSKQLPLSRFDHEYWTSWKSEVRNTNTLHIFKVNDLCMTIIIRE